MEKDIAEERRLRVANKARRTLIRSKLDLRSQLMANKPDLV